MIFKINRTYTVIIFFIFPLVLLKSANQLTHSYTGITLVAITVLWFCYKTGFFLVVTLAKEMEALCYFVQS